MNQHIQIGILAMQRYHLPTVMKTLNNRPTAEGPQAEF